MLQFKCNILIRLALPIAIYTFGMMVLVLNGLIIRIAGFLVPGFFVHDTFSAMGAAIALSTVTTGLGALLSIDEDNSWYSMVIQRQIQVEKKPIVTDIPGIIFLEIDGLEEPIL